MQLPFKNKLLTRDVAERTEIASLNLDIAMEMNANASNATQNTVRSQVSGKTNEPPSLSQAQAMYRTIEGSRPCLSSAVVDIVPSTPAEASAALG